VEEIPSNSRLGRLLAWCERRDVSDLHVRAGADPVVRVNGRLEPVPPGIVQTPDDLTLTAWFLEALSPALTARITTALEVDTSLQHGRVRYRANFSKQRGSQSFSLRTVPTQVWTLEDLQLPESLAAVLQEPRGLVLVTGATGQGKSTTARALLEHLNRESALRIITIEDPIEFLFADGRSHFEQREVGLDTGSFADGIRNAMRQDPNVIFVGEIRDRESIWACLQAAETGHLIVTTLHADSSAQALARVREFYPASEQASVSALLARNVNAILCQRLLPSVAGTRVPCLEVLRRDAGVQEAIRNYELELLTGIVEASNHVGMHSFDQYLQELLAAGVIDVETARRFAVNRHRLDLTLRGVVTTAPILKPSS
jgi:twitching motility protein PilT